MTKNTKHGIPNQQKFSTPTQHSAQRPITESLLDIMEDGREFVSILEYRVQNLNTNEIIRAIQEISLVTGRYTLCYLANSVNATVKANISINPTDDLPFSEMIRNVPPNIEEIDIIVVTPGGSGEQVAKFVDKLRPRFKNVRFIIPESAMSAGTIWVMSGDEIIMTSDSYIGPIDPQVRNREGQFVPAQSMIALIEDIRNRGNAALKAGQSPNWADIQILNRIDHKDLGSAITGSQYSIGLVKDFLTRYKFSSWHTHKSSGQAVTSQERENAALHTATKFCDHNTWKSHSRGIPREIAWNECKLQITHSESIANLDRAIRRFWAVVYWFFENTPIYKIFLSQNYSLMRQDASILNAVKS